MNYWWVNQNGTYRKAVPGGYMWSPKTKSNGVRNQFYDNMNEVEPGDIVFSFCDTLIKAVGIVTAKASTAMKPDFGKAGSTWSEEGWFVPVDYIELKKSIKPKHNMEVLAGHLPKKYSPLRKNGDGLQAVYLARLPTSFAETLIGLIGQESVLIAQLQGELTLTEVNDVADDAIEESIKGRTDIGPTTKDALVKSRRGQGIFKINVRLNEQRCRVTGVDNIKHLRASHIKPWAASSDEEKLHGCNGLLLAPHIDHLFDSGLISFTDSGDMLVSAKLNADVLQKWGILTPLNVEPFNPGQCEFLGYHRLKVYKHD